MRKLQTLKVESSKLEVFEVIRQLNDFISGKGVKADVEKVENCFNIYTRQYAGDEDTPELKANELLKVFNSLGVAEEADIVETGYGFKIVMGPDCQNAKLMEQYKVESESFYNCVICEDTFRGLGSNPWPIDTDPSARCCTTCESKYVGPARLKGLKTENNIVTEAEEDRAAMEHEASNVILDKRYIWVFSVLDTNGEYIEESIGNIQDAIEVLENQNGTFLVAFPYVDPKPGDDSVKLVFADNPGPITIFNREEATLPKTEIPAPVDDIHQDPAMETVETEAAEVITEAWTPDYEAMAEDILSALDDVVASEYGETLFTPRSGLIYGAYDKCLGAVVDAINSHLLESTKPTQTESNEPVPVADLFADMYEAIADLVYDRVVGEGGYVLPDQAALVLQRFYAGQDYTEQELYDMMENDPDALYYLAKVVAESDAVEYKESQHTRVLPGVFVGTDEWEMTIVAEQERDLKQVVAVVSKAFRKFDSGRVDPDYVVEDLADQLNQMLQHNPALSDYNDFVVDSDYGEYGEDFLAEVDGEPIMINLIDRTPFYESTESEEPVILEGMTPENQLHEDGDIHNHLMIENFIFALREQLNMPEHEAKQLAVETIMIDEIIGQVSDGEFEDMYHGQAYYIMEWPNHDKDMDYPKGYDFDLNWRNVHDAMYAKYQEDSQFSPDQKDMASVLFKDIRDDLYFGGNFCESLLFHFDDDEAWFFGELQDNLEDRKEYCRGCGDEIGPDSGQDSPDSELCHSCYNDEYMSCPRCGREKEDEGDEYCEYCNEEMTEEEDDEYYDEAKKAKDKETSKDNYIEDHYLTIQFKAAFVEANATAETEDVLKVFREHLAGIKKEAFKDMHKLVRFYYEDSNDADYISDLITESEAQKLMSYFSNKEVTVKIKKMEV